MTALWNLTVRRHRSGSPAPHVRPGDGVDARTSTPPKRSTVGREEQAGGWEDGRRPRGGRGAPLAP